MREPVRGWALIRAGLLLAAALLFNPLPSPLSLPEDFRAAQTFTAQQDYASAADALADAAARLPYDGYTLYRAGLADISAERFDTAVRRLLTSAALDGWTPTRHIALGDAYLGQGNRDFALAQWEMALADLPEDDGLLARLANNYEAAGRYPDAIRILNTLARVRPADRAVHYRLALLTAVTTPAEAMARLALVAEIAPDLAPTVQALQQAIQGGLDSGDEAYTLGRVGFAFIQLNEWALAKLALAHAVERDPEYADAYAYLGLAQDRLGEDGRAAYETALQLAPDSPLTHFFLGLHWRRAGDLNQALAELQRAQELDSRNPAIAAELGGVYAALGDLLSAETWFAHAVSLDERNPQFWLLLARFYTDTDFQVAERGLPAARMAVSLNPDSALAADALGYALVLTGDPVNGEKMLEQAVRLDPNLPSAYYHLGLLYAQRGQTEQAQAALNHTLTLDPNGRYGGLALQVLARLSP